MTRKQVLVQLDDELVNDLDTLAARLGVSRSELIRRSARAFVVSLENAEKDRVFAKGYSRQPADPDLVASFEQIARETMPPW